MTRNQLPEGVGKKIVEALKRQAEADITYMDDNKNININNTVPISGLDNSSEIQSIKGLKADNSNDIDLIVEEDDESNNVLIEGAYKTKENEPSVQDTVVNTIQGLDFKEIKPQNIQPENKQNMQIQYQQPMQQVYQQPIQPQVKETIKPEIQMQQTYQQTYQPQQYQTTNNTTFSSNINIDIPENIVMMQNLIASLPTGVPKQTGAQIIRQTLEAMGISMTSVMKQTQEIQEQLNGSARGCMLKIQEYKTLIMQLEQSVQEYQKHMNQINDLVSLFLLTEKK